MFDDDAHHAFIYGDPQSKDEPAPPRDKSDPPTMSDAIRALARDTGAAGPAADTMRRAVVHHPEPPPQTDHSSLLDDARATIARSRRRRF